MLKLARDSRVRCVALSNDGDVLVVGGFDKKVLLLDVHSGARLTSCPGADDTVRSVHLSADSRLMALGCEKRGKGCALLYALPEGELRHLWQHDKVVWCVRLSPDSQLLVACGYDMQMAVYATTTFEKLHSVKYPIFGGPAFIWSCEFSADSSRLAVGCWNSRAYLYELTYRPNSDKPSDRKLLTDATVDAAAAPPAAAEDSPLTVVELAVAVRADRVYAVSLDKDGRHMAVGGRDKKLALYTYNDGALDLRWEKLSEDFVYAVALSDDMQYCALGGTAKQVVVYAASTGLHLHTIALGATVWAVTLHTLPSGATQLVAGGEFSSIKVIDVREKKEVLHLPADETTFDIALSADSLAYTDGLVASVLGHAGANYSWQDAPCFHVVSSWVMAMLQREDELLHAISLLLARSPALVNARHPESGASLLHYVVYNTNLSKLVQVGALFHAALSRPPSRNPPPQETRARSPTPKAPGHPPDPPQRSLDRPPKKS